MPAKYVGTCRVGHSLQGPGRCRTCRDSYMREYRLNNPERMATIQAQRVRTPESLAACIAAAKLLRHYRRYDGIVFLGGICVDCGYKTHLDALQFDHIPERGTPDRKAVLGTYGWERMKEELRKCELVCANCHAIRTQSRRGEEVGRIGGFHG